MKWTWLFTAVVGAAMVGGCGESESTQADSGATNTADSATPMKSEAGYISGKVLGEDGKPIAVGEDISVSVYGVSEAGEKVSYAPAVKPDGSYRQKVVPGSYRVSRGQVKVKFGDDLFSFDLVPQGTMANKDRDAAEGITQDFVWKVTGQRTAEKPDPNNHTHWYGMNIGARYAGYRDDTGKVPPVPPKGTIMRFTLKPLSKCVDGRDLKETVIERPWDPAAYPQMADLNDLPPAHYEISGVATLPDGSTKPLLLQGRGDYPKFVPSTKAMLEKDGIIGGMFKLNMGVVTE